jgi:hypothetical protein
MGVEQIWLEGIDVYSQLRNKITFYPVIEGAYVNTKNWYRKEADFWAVFGNKFRSAGKDLFRGFGKDACGRQYVFVRQKDCLRWIRGITW